MAVDNNDDPNKTWSYLIMRLCITQCQHGPSWTFLKPAYLNLSAANRLFFWGGFQGTVYEIINMRTILLYKMTTAEKRWIIFKQYPSLN